MSLSIGIMLPSRETAMTGRHDARGLIEFARIAEESGFDSVWTGDSVLARTRVDPLTLLAAVSARTSRVTLGTAALIGPLRPPLLTSAQAATVDQLSGGRLILGLGSGSPLPESRREFDALAMPFRDRARRLDEAAELWRQAWAGGSRFSGRYWQIDGLDSALPPARPGGPPLWLAGGDSDRVIARVAEGYDGWLPYLPDAGAYARAWARIGELTPRPITPALYATVCIDDDRRRAHDTLDTYTRTYYRQPLDVLSSFQAICGGSAQECAAWLAGYVDAGARHLVLRIGSLDPDPRMLAGRLLPLLRQAGSS
ncbi:LLM class flavin-dependent oxidoreductase [Mycolicibacterium septicum]|uniref:LLM class flavin-dependent oxidoreductase n=1 Tax=Mycolicibacterium septicum TaxID=98668 RepID=UPI0023E0FAF7|nr:LLM class flavin-dependent oxidoreductase [Mycolicibacterium septicum]MDF3336100.1 LLM class flavin-dependent oxidoreductase [Mycolicibacterium septicum]